MSSPADPAALPECDAHGSSPPSGSSPLDAAGAGPAVVRVNFLRFNQDVTSLAVATAEGYKLFSFNNGVDTLEIVHEKRMEAENAVSIVERLFSSSLVALVQRASPRKLRVCHFKKGTEICNYSYSNTVLSVRLNRARLVVCLEEALYIHNIRDMKIMHTIKDTPPNPKGICALSANSDKCFLAYPGSSSTGEVQLFDALNLQATGMIAAHDGPLAALAFSPEGTMLATASEKGTIVRVFNVEDGSKLTEFRRGVKRCAQVSSLGFSADSKFLVLGSNTETIHVFKLPEEQPQQQQPETEKAPATNPEDDSWMGYFSSAVSATASYLPAQVTDTLNQSRAFTTVTVPSFHTTAASGARGASAGGGVGTFAAEMPNQVALATIGRKLRVLLATTDGYLYIYDLPASEGGECVLVKTHHLGLQFPKDSASASAVEGASDHHCEPVDAPRASTTYAAQQIRQHKDGSPEDAERPAVLPVTPLDPPQLQGSPPFADEEDAIAERLREADIGGDEDSDSPPPVQKMPVKANF